MKSVMLGVYGVLNQKLEENNASATEGFVFGPRPSTLDAVLFAHVAQLILTSDSLSYVLHRFPRLMAFYEWVMGSFFLGREAAGCSEDSGHVVAVPKVVLPSFLHVSCIAL